MAKMLFHIIPVSGDFKVTFNDLNGKPTKPITMGAEGFFSFYTIGFLKDAVADFIDLHTFDADHQDHLKAIENALDAVTLASDHALSLGLKSTSEAFYDSFQQGKSIILPAGWFAPVGGHALDIVINKTHNLLLIANNGYAYKTIESGVNIFKIHNPEKITAELIYDMLNNTGPADLEIKLAAKLGLERLDVISEMDQITGNCSWQSQESGLEALLYIEFLNQGYTSKDAKSSSQTLYHEWDAHQTYEFVHTYFEGDSRLPAVAVAALIKTQAYLTESKTLSELLQDDVGAYLVEVYKDQYHMNPNTINLNYDPYKSMQENFSQEELDAISEVLDFKKPDNNLSELLQNNEEVKPFSETPAPVVEVYEPSAMPTNAFEQVEQPVEYLLI